MITNLSFLGVLSDRDSLEVQCSDAKDTRYHEVHCMLGHHSWKSFVFVLPRTSSQLQAV